MKMVDGLKKLLDFPFIEPSQSDVYIIGQVGDRLDNLVQILW